MPELVAETALYPVVIEIGDIPIRVNTTDPTFARMLQDRYTGFLTDAPGVDLEFDADLFPGKAADSDADVCVTRSRSRWRVTRGDFVAEWDAISGRGRVRHSPNPYSIDSILRIVHSLVLAKEGGLLLHSASAIRNGKAFLFAGVSGAGKTTISRLAPHDVTLLTDEISYVRCRDGVYTAFGTPFAGELAKVGENVAAPVSALYLLTQGPENRIDRLALSEAARSVLANVLFFAEDEELVRSIFNTVVELVSRIPVSRLTFAPDSRVWELIG